MKTIKDVALLADVSLTTVSRVLNNSEKVSDKTRERVDNAIKKLRYTPNNAARSLVRKQTGAVAILLRKLHDPFFADLIRGIEDAAAMIDRNIIFCSPGNDEKVRDRYIEYLINGTSDAVILYGSLFTDKMMIEHLRNVNFPFLLIENNFPELPVNQFIIDNLTGAKQAMEHFIAMGHKRIAHVMGNPNKKVILERLNGYFETMQAHRLLIREGYILGASSDSAAFEAQMKRLADMPEDERPTAFFCSDDKIARSVADAVVKMGLSVPEDISVIGFDNVQNHSDSYQGPKITSIQQPLYDIGYDAMMVIDGILNGSIETPVCETYTTSLAAHESVLKLV